MTKENEILIIKDPFEYTGIDPTIREKRGLTHEEVVKRTGGKISVRTLKAYEKGETDATASRLMALSKALDTTTDALLKIKTTTMLAYENSRIPKYVKDKKNIYRRSRKEEDFYYIDSNIEDFSEMAAVVLDTHSTVLNLPVGTTLLVDTSRDCFNNLEGKSVKILLVIKGKLFPTVLSHNPQTRRKHTYTISKPDNSHLTLTREQLLENKSFIGIIKKAILDF